MSYLAVNDPAPHNRSRLGYWLGVVFHPFTVFIPALLVVLKGTDPAVAAGWIVFIAVIIVVYINTAYLQETVTLKKIVFF